MLRKTNNKVFFAVDVMMKSRGLRKLEIVRVSQWMVLQTEGHFFYGPVRVPVRIPVPAARDWTADSAGRRLTYNSRRWPDVQECQRSNKIFPIKRNHSSLSHCPETLYQSGQFTVPFSSTSLSNTVEEIQPVHGLTQLVMDKDASIINNK